MHDPPPLVSWSLVLSQHYLTLLYPPLPPPISHTVEVLSEEECSRAIAYTPHQDHPRGTVVGCTYRLCYRGWRQGKGVVWRVTLTKVLNVQASTPDEHQAVDKVIDKGKKLEAGIINRSTILSEWVGYGSVWLRSIHHTITCYILYKDYYHYGLHNQQASFSAPTVTSCACIHAFLLLVRM